MPLTPRGGNAANSGEWFKPRQVLRQAKTSCGLDNFLEQVGRREEKFPLHRLCQAPNRFLASTSCSITRSYMMCGAPTPEKMIEMEEQLRQYQ